MIKMMEHDRRDNPWERIAARLDEASLGTRIELRLIRAGALQSLGVTIAARPAR